eukprot:gene1959-2297_t
MPDLFDDLTIKSWIAPNRLVMAPLTRNRADEQGVPGDLAVEYYAQRASAGLIISEGTQPSAVGQGYLLTRDTMTYFHDHYITDAKHDLDWRASPLLHGDLS